MKILQQSIQLSAQRHFSQNQSTQLREQQFLDGNLQQERVLSSQQSVQEKSFSELRIGSESLITNDAHKRNPVTANHPPQNAILSEQSTPSLRDNFRGFNQFRPSDINNQAIAEDNLPTLPPQLLKMIEAVEAMMERLTGQPYKLQVYGYSRGNEPAAENPRVMQGDKLPQQTLSGKGISIQFEHRFSEQESLRFQAQGHVTTADGRQIDFSLQTLQARSFSTQTLLQLQQGVVPTDPLVVNFGGQPAQLTLNKISLDLDNNSEQDQVNMLQPGSGFLALDKNEDGQIATGSELFGTLSGNGFAELAAYDEDGNGWIDEGDAVFAQLKIYHQDANGLMQLDGLMDLDIGAISLNSVAGDFSLKDDNNQTLGQVRSNGLFLSESTGLAGSVQQIDLVI